VSPLIKLGGYSALFLGLAYGAKRYNYLKPRAEEERRLAAEGHQFDLWPGKIPHASGHLNPCTTTTEAHEP
ncbi:hypothetical protein FD755_024867, partial [Muntiacus reevesi]